MNLNSKYSELAKYVYMYVMYKIYVFMDYVTVYLSALCNYSSFILRYEPKALKL